MTKESKRRERGNVSAKCQEYFAFAEMFSHLSRSKTFLQSPRLDSTRKSAGGEFLETHILMLKTCTASSASER